jgi:hypothetical protein
MIRVGPVATLATGEESIRLPNDWMESGQIFIQQDEPLPLHVVTVTVDYEVGGP